MTDSLLDDLRAAAGVDASGLGVRHGVQREAATASALSAHETAGAQSRGVDDAAIERATEGDYRDILAYAVREAELQAVADACLVPDDVAAHVETAYERCVAADQERERADAVVLEQLQAHQRSYVTGRLFTATGVVADELRRRAIAAGRRAAIGKTPRERPEAPVRCWEREP